MEKRSNMKLDDTANEIIDWFTRGIYPAPYTFTDQQIESMSKITGTDKQGTFADAPMEQALVSEYRLDAGQGENTWPGFARALREEKNLHLSKFSGERESNMNWLKEAIANCLVVGVPPERIVEQAKTECGIPC